MNILEAKLSSIPGLENLSVPHNPNNNNNNQNNDNQNNNNQYINYQNNQTIIEESLVNGI